MQEQLIKRAKELFKEGKVNRVLGWKKGEFGYDLTPGVFDKAEELDTNFIYNCFSAANLSKYLIKLKLQEGVTLVFLKPCDTYSFTQLLKEHRINRDRVYVVGVPCSGMIAQNLLEAKVGDEIGRAHV